MGVAMVTLFPNPSQRQPTIIPSVITNNMAQTPQYLIRSASSLLSIIGQQVEQPRQLSHRRSVRFLDRIARLFVTGPGEDVSAVSAVLSGSGSILVRCTDSSDDGTEDETAGTGETTKYSVVTNDSPKVRVKYSPAAAGGLDPTGSSQTNGGQSENIDGVDDDASAGQSTMYVLLFHSPRLQKDWLTSSGWC